MTKDEYISKEKTLKAYNLRNGLVSIVFALILMVTWQLLNGKKDFHATRLLSTVFVCVYFAQLLFFVALGVRRMKQLGLVCPKCRKLLAESSGKTGDCRNCGETVVTG